MAERNKRFYFFTTRDKSGIWFALQTILLGRKESLEIDKYFSDAIEGESLWKRNVHFSPNLNVSNLLENEYGEDFELQE